MKRHNLHVINFLKKHSSNHLLEEWNSEENQLKFRSIRSYNPDKKRRCTCYILYCLDKRDELKKQYPFYTNSQITSILAKNWRDHKNNNDDIYNYYKEKDKKQLFFTEQDSSLAIKYPHLSKEELNSIIEKMYKKINN